MISSLGVDDMELVRYSYRSYSQIEIYKTYGISVVTSEARHLDGLCRDFVLRYAHCI